MYYHLRMDNVEHTIDVYCVDGPKETMIKSFCLDEKKFAHVFVDGANESARQHESNEQKRQADSTNERTLKAVSVMVTWDAPRTSYLLTPDYGPDYEPQNDDLTCTYSGDEYLADSIDELMGITYHKTVQTDKHSSDKTSCSGPAEIFDPTESKIVHPKPKPNDPIPFVAPDWAAWFHEFEKNVKEKYKTGLSREPDDAKLKSNEQGLWRGVYISVLHKGKVIDLHKAEVAADGALDAFRKRFEND